MNEKNLVVVTGGAGFIGAHLCSRLVKEGHRVISLDNYFTGSEENHIAGVEYRRGHTKDISTFIPETPDLLFHLGEYSRTAVAMEEPAEVWDLNILGTYQVLEFCRRHQSKLVYAGSSTKHAPKRAVDGVAGRDLSPYTWAKAINTELVMNYHRWYELPVAVTYFYNVYGPGERAGRYGTAVEIFKQHYLAGTSATVHGPGTQTRNYTHVDDTIDGLLLVAAAGIGDEFGIGASEVYSPIDVCELFGVSYEVGPQRKTSRPGASVDTKKTEALGWRQTRTLEAYIADIKQASPR